MNIFQNFIDFFDDPLQDRILIRLRRIVKPRIGNIAEAIEQDDVVVLSQLRRTIKEEIDTNNNNNGGQGGASLAFNGDRPITRLGPYFGLIPGGQDIITFTENYWYPAVGPAIALSIAGGNVRELGANPNISLIWTVTKETYGISNIVVDSSTITPPSSVNNDGVPFGTTASGTKASSSVPNVDTTFTGQVTAHAQVASASVTLNWENAIYFGNIAKDGKSGGQNITNSDILAANSGFSPFTPGSGKRLATSRLQSYDGINGNGNYPFFAWPSRFGNPTFIANGLTTTAWTKVWDALNFTNGNGYAEPYDVWIGDTVQNSPITKFQVQ